METKQSLKSRLVEILEGTNLFSHINLKGDLDFEDNTLIIEYQRNPTSNSKNFHKGNSTLDEKLKKTVEQYLLGIEMKPQTLNEHKVYQIVLKRKPYEGLGTDTTKIFLRQLLEQLSDKYLFRL